MLMKVGFGIRTSGFFIFVRKPNGWPRRVPTSPQRSIQVLVSFLFYSKELKEIKEEKKKKKKKRKEKKIVDLTFASFLISCREDP